MPKIHLPAHQVGKNFARTVGMADKAKSKFSNVRVQIDGFTFDSKAEAGRYADLKILERAGEIHSLGVHPVFYAWVNGVLVTKYTADFQYVDQRSQLVVEDVKSRGTRLARDWPLRKRLVQAACRITITEVLI